MLDIQEKLSANTTGTLQGVGKVWVNTGAKQKRGKCVGPVVARGMLHSPSRAPDLVVFSTGYQGTE